MRKPQWSFCLYLVDEKTTPEKEAVVLTGVLGDSVNVGYQDLIVVQLVKVNGRKLVNLRELISIVENSKEEFITFSFGKNEQPVTLNLPELRKATTDILRRYHVPADRSESLQ